MIYQDMNCSWVEPSQFDSKYQCTDVRAEGSFLLIEYRKFDLWPGGAIQSRTTVVVFINDMGREVGRSVETDLWPEPQPEKPPVHLSLWQRIQIWLETLTLDTQEIFKWRRK